MKKSPLATILLVLLAISAVWSVILCMQFINNARQIRQLSARAAAIQASQGAFRALVVETQEYARTNRALDHILRTIGIERTVPAPGAPSTTK